MSETEDILRLHEFMSDPPDENVSYRAKDTWDRVSGYWPRRLLHIPTMTSLERQEGDTYGPVQRPSYGILTYTWGRWERQDGRRIGIKGTSWMIPAVDESHFSVEDFERVIRKMAEKNDFAWIDVGCIDQENSAVKMDEITKQVGIFSNAQNVYIWLSHHGTAQLQKLLDDLSAFETFLYDGFNEQTLERRLEKLGALAKTVSAYLQDPWFSSLWTLQEGTLRRDALLLSRQGQTVTQVHRAVHTGKRFHGQVYHKDILNSLWNICYTFRMSRLVDKEALRPSMERIASIITAAGYSHMPLATNPNIQYGAAYYRKTTMELDRIYGIMAIYGIVLGDENPYEYTLEDLEYRFAASLNTTSPLLAQSFVHTSKPKTGRSWMITQRCRVTDDMGGYEKDGENENCFITGTAQRHARFRGQTSPLGRLVDVLRASLLHRTLPAGIVQIRLDDYVFDDYPNLPNTLEVELLSNLLRPNSAEAFALADALLSGLGNANVVILLLGVEKIRSLGVKEWGLILLKCDGEDNGYTRLGICQWLNYDPITNLDGPAPSLEWDQNTGMIM